MKGKNGLEDLKKQVEDLSLEMRNVNFALRGTIWKHYMKCGNARCKCHADPPALHGPYYDWSRKVKGKTVNIRLSKGEAEVLEGWIENMKRLEKALREIEALSIRAAGLIRK